MLSMKKKRGLILSIIVALMLIAIPISVKVVLENVVVKSGAEVDTNAAYSHRIMVEEPSIVESKPFYIRYLPEIGGLLVFAWLLSVLFWLGFVRKRRR